MAFSLTDALKAHYDEERSQQSPFTIKSDEASSATIISAEIWGILLLSLFFLSEVFDVLHLHPHVDLSITEYVSLLCSDATHGSVDNIKHLEMAG